jgi:hypothetical protein
MKVFERRTRDTARSIQLPDKGCFASGKST